MYRICLAQRDRQAVGTLVELPSGDGRAGGGDGTSTQSSKPDHDLIFGVAGGRGA